MDTAARYLDCKDEFAALAAHVDRLGSPVRVLEAGCGRNFFLPLKAEHKVTGVDTDATALERWRQTTRHFEAAIVGDICTVSLPAGDFDAIVCSYVLEHVHGAETALKNFTRWLRPGGLILIRMPDKYSAYGFLARYTPHWVHLFYYRHIQRFANAGKDGFGPYPVAYDEVVSEKGIQDFCFSNGLKVVESSKTGYYLRHWPAKMVAILMWLVSFGRLKWRHNNLVFVLQKT